MILLTIKIRVLQDREKELVQTIRSLSQGTSGEQGFLGAGVYRDVDNENCILILQRWETREDLDEHLRTDAFGVLMGALNVLADSWEVRFDAVSSSEGEEAILAVRAPEPGTDTGRTVQ